MPLWSELALTLIVTALSLHATKNASMPRQDWDNILPKPLVELGRPALLHPEVVPPSAAAAIDLLVQAKRSHSGSGQKQPDNSGTPKREHASLLLL